MKRRLCRLERSKSASSVVLVVPKLIVVIVTISISSVVAVAATITITITTVSYTHLDVYKRQANNIPFDNFNLKNAGFNFSKHQRPNSPIILLKRL